MKILVTGSEGLTGGEAVDFFTEMGHDVIGIDNNMRSQALGTPAKNPAHDIDIRDEKSINKLFKKNKFDVVIHCAGQASHHRYQNEPLIDFDINARATVILLHAARTNNPDCIFVYCSSDKVYGASMTRELTEQRTRFHNDTPFDESLSVDNGEHSLFGASKLAADIYVKEFGYAYNMATVCFRLGCITGKRHEGSHFHGFLANLTRCIKNEEVFYLQGFSTNDEIAFKGKQVRDNIHSYDLVNAMWHFIQNPKVAAVYNMGGGPDRSCSVIEAIAAIEKKTGKKARIQYIEQHSGDRAWDIHDVSKFRKDYPDWDYKYSLDDIFTELCHK